MNFLNSKWGVAISAAALIGVLVFWVGPNLGKQKVAAKQEAAEAQRLDSIVVATETAHLDSLEQAQADSIAAVTAATAADSIKRSGSVQGVFLAAADSNNVVLARLRILKRDSTGSQTTGWKVVPKKVTIHRSYFDGGDTTVVRQDSVPITQTLFNEQWVLGDSACATGVLTPNGQQLVFNFMKAKVSARVTNMGPGQPGHLSIAGYGYTQPYLERNNRLVMTQKDKDGKVIAKVEFFVVLRKGVDDGAAASFCGGEDIFFGPVAAPASTPPTKTGH